MVHWDLRFGFAFGLASTSLIQAQPNGGWVIDEVVAPVTPSRPIATLRINAWFDHAPGQAEMFANGLFDLQAADGRFTEVRWPLLLPLGQGPFFEGSVVREVGARNPNFPPHLPGNPANPILAVEVDWTTSDFSPRSVRIHTTTDRFWVYQSVSSPAALRIEPPDLMEGEVIIQVRSNICYPDCDTSTGMNVLDIFDYLCFQNRYSTNATYACDCDTATGPGVCDVFDFLCFQNAFAAGCP